MRFLTSRLPLILAASASLVAAQDATTTGSPATATKCAAQKVVDQCILEMKFQLENCDPSDWDCKCTGSANIVNCYNNCPEDSERLGAQQIREQNCINAKAYGTKTTMAETASSAFASSSASASASMSWSPSATAEPTGSRSGLKSNNDDSSEPTKSLTELEATSTPSQGAAAARVKAVGGWLAFLGLSLGILV